MRINVQLAGFNSKTRGFVAESPFFLQQQSKLNGLQFELSDNNERSHLDFEMNDEEELLCSN